MGEGGQVLDVGGRISGMRGNCGRPPLPTKFVEQISFQEIEEREFLGKGSFGVVIRGFWRGQDVAVKIFHKDSEQEAFKVELRQLSRVDHPNIIRLYAASTTHYVFLVMEYAECGSLYKVLHEKKGEHQVYYHSGHAISWVLQCALGVEYLHNMRPKPIIHRDLKSPNLLLVNEGLGLKICDFGTACDQHTVMTNNKGSAAWMAPEVFEGTEYSEKCDIFSFGIILWEIFTRRLPFQDSGNDLQILWAIHNGKRPPPIQDFPTVLENLMERCWAANIQIRPNMSDVVNQIREIQRFFPEASDPLMFSEGEINPQTFAESISEVTDEEDIRSLTSDKTFQTAQDTLKSVSPNFDYSKSEVDDVLECSSKQGLDATSVSSPKTNNVLDANVTPSSLLNPPTNKEPKDSLLQQPELIPTLQPLDFTKLNKYNTKEHTNTNVTCVSTNSTNQSPQIQSNTGGSQKLLHSSSQHLGTPSSAGTPKTPSPRLRSLLNMAGYSSQDIQDASMSPVTPPSHVRNQQEMLSCVKPSVTSCTPISIPLSITPTTLTSSEPTKTGMFPQQASSLRPVQGYRTPPEELGPHHVLHPHQGSQFQGIPQLPQYDPKILQNAPKELMRGISYPIPDEEPYLQGPRYAWMENAQSPPQAVYPPMYFPPNQSFPYYHPGSVAGRYGHYPTARPNYPLSDYIPAPYFPQAGVATGASKVENELAHSRSHSSIKGLTNMMDRTHLDPTQQHTSVADGDVPCGSPGSHRDPRILSPSALGLPPGVHSGSQHSPVHGMVPPNQPNSSYNWRSFQNPIGQYYHDPNAVDDRWAHWGASGAVPNQGNSPSSHGGSGGQLDPKLYDIPASMGTTATPNTTANVGEATPSTTKWQNKMMPYDMLSGNNYPVGNMFSGYGGGSSFSRRPNVNNSMYPREPRGIGPFLPRVPPAQTPIGSLMPQAHSPYNLSPHGSQGLGSVTGADYSPRAKRREGAQQTRPISADVGRLFAVEEHSNERTGTNVSEETSSHGQGGFKKGHRRASSYGSTPSNNIGLRVNSTYGQQQRPQRTDYGLNHGHSYTQLDPQHDGNIMGQSSYIGGPHPALIPQEHCMYNHDGMLDPMDLLDPELRPIPPQPGCEPSMQIYQDHRKMATDYLNVRNEINEMRQRKLELEETLKMSDEDLLRSVIRNERSQHQGQLPSGPALHIQPDPAEVEQYLQLTTEKNNLVQLKEKLTTQLDMIKQAQIKQTQSRSGITQPSNVSNEPSKGGLAPKTTQDPRMVSAPSKDAESSTAKALSLSLAPSVAMTLGSGTIPPNVLTPPSNEQKVLLSQPQVPFARQISSNSDVGDSDTEWVVVKRAQTNPDDTKQT